METSVVRPHPAEKHLSKLRRITRNIDVALSNYDGIVNYESIIESKSSMYTSIASCYLTYLVGPKVFYLVFFF